MEESDTRGGLHSNHPNLKHLGLRCTMPECLAHALFGIMGGMGS